MVQTKVPLDALRHQNRMGFLFGWTMRDRRNQEFRATAHDPVRHDNNNRPILQSFLLP